MNITRTAPELLSTYNRLKHTAETLDKSNLDTDERDDYVTISLNRSEGEGENKIEGTHTINSFPSTDSKTTVNGLISRTSSVTSFNIEEIQHADTPEQGPVTHKLSFKDDGRTLRVSESITSLDSDTFLASEKQEYIIFQKSGKMKTLKPQSSGPVEL